jgi:phage baseplate assembly protein W
MADRTAMDLARMIIATTLAERHMQPAYRITARRMKDQPTKPTPKRAKVKAARKQRQRND